MVVYHTTRISSIPSILENGFCPSYFEYGENGESDVGVYFAKDMYESLLVMLLKIKDRKADHCVLEVEIDSLDGYVEDGHKLMNNSYYTKGAVTDFKILRIYDYSERFWNGTGRQDSYDFQALAKHLSKIKGMMPVIDTESVA